MYAKVLLCCLGTKMSLLRRFWEGLGSCVPGMFRALMIEALQLHDIQHMYITTAVL